MLISNWTKLHAIDLSLLQDVLLGSRMGALATSPFQCAATPRNRPPIAALPRIDAALKDIIAPAFAPALGTLDTVQEMLGTIRFAPLSQSAVQVPHVIDAGAGEDPILVMEWRATPADLICLAHEAAHAMQLIMSRGTNMPPIARETCAFLGELLVIAHVRHDDPALFDALVDVWEEENATYLGDDLDALSAALRAPDAGYHYRQNYPVARLAAVRLFAERGEGDLRDIFASGADAMAHVPLAAMADKASETFNYLKAMPPAAPDQPVADAYRRLGAMALLDIDFWQGVSETRIEDYYTDLLTHLQKGTTHVALNAARKPIGYATWEQNPDTNHVPLTRQAAPFGDHIALQNAVEARIGAGATVTARHERSARQEQAAW